MSIPAPYVRLFAGEAPAIPAATPIRHLVVTPPKAAESVAVGEAVSALLETPVSRLADLSPAVAERALRFYRCIIAAPFAHTAEAAARWVLLAIADAEARG